ncbi:hypothetical protein, partial [Mycobacterium persicum]|uniref:hypothetical protein n=1 Tax=Mycobacterium persicum TaxID=1487726 RepID=UPI0013C349D5
VSSFFVFYSIHYKKKKKQKKKTTAGVGDAEIGCGADDGDDAAVVAAVVIGVKQYQVGCKLLICPRVTLPAGRRDLVQPLPAVGGHVPGWYGWC